MNSEPQRFENPFRPGAGHAPPYLAGRNAEMEGFRRLLHQTPVLENLLLTGLRGVGKTVLLEKLRPIALQEGWQWVGTDLSETTTISEANVVTRLLTDLSVVTSSTVLRKKERVLPGFTSITTEHTDTLDYGELTRIYTQTPGLVADKLKAVLEIAWSKIRLTRSPGLIFAYDEAQTLADHAEKEEFPLSLLLDVFQSIQRKGIRFMLALTGLPTLFPKLVEARTYSERMYRVVTLASLDIEASREAILKPIEQHGCPVTFSDAAVDEISSRSHGYPYFIQFICREAFEAFLRSEDLAKPSIIPMDNIIRKLDADFFQGRWARATDRQRDLLTVAATLDSAGREFEVKELVAQSKEILEKPFKSSHISQMLVTLAESGLIYKNRWGKYSFAVPLMDQFINRQNQTH